ncbi:GFA family protein [Roseibium marinum]|uniref:CENP-V/GFA domain-containing protein n=1 Tax=Roseibium marinum TaxID=281252 RepID=A0A2S3UZ72_9HYPH|nr:GFA family protein [Roseibium marinum]POF33021.1 hypothetical protein CLV41_102427 [Roseibium marinum]
MIKSDDTTDNEITGRCYCGATTIRATRQPMTIAYCHCADCRRVTGAPVAAFAAFDAAAVTFTPDAGQKVTATPGVERTFCGNCGSPISGRYDYLPGQVYIPVGVLEQANRLAPRLHAHASQRLTWLHIEDDLQRFDASSRVQLLKAQNRQT